MRCRRFSTSSSASPSSATKSAPGCCTSLRRSWPEPRLTTFAVPILAAALLLAAGYAPGRALTRRLEPAVSPASIVLALTAGLALIGQAGFLLGILGLLRPVVVLPLAASANFAFGREWIEFRAALAGAGGGRRIPLAVVFPALALAPVILLAFYPASDFDATMYHLPYAQAFAASGHLPFLPDLRFPVFPQLTEVLFAMVLPAGRDLAAQCLSFGALLLTAALLIGWGRAEPGSATGWIAAAAFLGNPIMAYFGTTAYVEPTLTLLATAAFLSFERWQASDRTGWVLLAGFFAGTAAAVKYLGLLLVVAVAVAVWFSRRRARPALFFSTAALASLAPWYLRIWWTTGNPVFPYLAGVFGRSAWDLSGYQLRFAGAGDLLSRFVAAPWDLLFPDRHFDWHPPFSPVNLVLAPALVLAFLRRSRWRPLLIVAAAYALFVLTLPRDPRYLMPILPAASLFGCSTLLDLLKRSGSALRTPAVATVVAILLAPSTGYAARLLWKRGAPPASEAARERYLAWRQPLYSAIAFANHTYGNHYSLYAFDAENMVFFARGRFRGDWFGPYNYERMRRAAATPESLFTELRTIDATHVLFGSRWRPAYLESPEMLRSFRPLYADAHARLYGLGVAPR